MLPWHPHVALASESVKDKDSSALNVAFQS